MNVLSVFDGISCGQLALTKAGIQIDQYYASEIEQPAITITQQHFPNTIQLGDIRSINAESLPPIDLLIGGSPCQSFSLSGKRNGMSTVCAIEVTTFEQYLELKEQNFQFDGQSYLFWEYVRLLKELKPTYFLLENVKMQKKWEAIITQTLECPAIVINSEHFSAQNRHRLYWTNIPIGEFESSPIVLDDIIEPVSNQYKIKVNNNIHPNEKGKNIKCMAWNYQDGRVYGLKGKSNALLRSSGTMILDDRITADQLVHTEGRGIFQSIVSEHIKGVIRQLTPLECERLQTLPDNYTNVENISNSRRYAHIGNGWTVDVIAHIFKGIKKATD